MRLLIKYNSLKTLISALPGIAGAALSLYLLYHHYALFHGVSGIVFNNICKLNQAFDCESVAMSRWSIVAGVPVALWGVFGFFSHILLRYGKFERLSSITAGSMFAASLWLFYISKTKINAYCPFCLAIYVVSIIIVIQSVAVNYTKSNSGGGKFFADLKNEVSLLFNNQLSRYTSMATVGIFFLIFAFFPPYWNMPSIESSLTRCGTTEDANPFIESKEPPVVTVEQYGDYECGYCKNGQRMIRRLISRGAKARLVHKNYPLSALCNPLVTDPNFHKSSCGMSLLAIAAHETYDAKMFWRINDFIYNNREFSLAGLKKLNVDIDKIEKAANSKPVAYLLAKDVLHGIQHKLTGTPAYFINGEKKQLPEVLTILKGTMKGKT